MSNDIPSLDDYDFELPEELIAQEPAPQRDASRLLVLGRKSGEIQHHRFPHLLEELRRGDLLVLNRTKVIPARLFGQREATGGKVEVLLLKPTQTAAMDALVKTRGKPQLGETLILAEGRLRAKLLAKDSRGCWSLTLETSADEKILNVLKTAGTMPLPPYIKRAAEADARDSMDRERYQTVFAKTDGAVAAPTAGLHFSAEIFAALAAKGIELAEILLHVGIGTFAPIESEDFRDHKMHAEFFEVSAAAAAAVNSTRQRGDRVVAVGTTSLRSLESAWNNESARVEAKSGKTRLFVYPPQKVKSVDAMVTNFHLPRSSLMLLVSAFASRDRIMAAYAKAVDENYRFFSYGDAMLII